MSAVARLHKLYPEGLSTIMFKGELWTEYTIYRLMGCLRGDFFKYHTYTMESNDTKIVFSYGIYDQKVLDNLIKESRQTKQIPSILKNALTLTVQDGLIATSEDLAVLVGV